MQKVIGINLNGQAFHLEESGYEAMRAYLDAAAARLESNPDRAEILADIEQAIGEKCAACLGPQKSVVTAPEVDRILTEMGPVRNPDAQETTQSHGESSAGTTPPASAAGEPAKRLYQIREGAMFTGVCNGIAAYLGIDVTIVRVAFVVLAVLTKGAFALVYLALSFLIPFADTAEERAAAHGVRFNAQELVGRTRDFKRQQREWRRQWRRARRRGFWPPQAVAPQADYAGQVWARATAPVFALLQAAAFILLVLAIVSFVNTSTVFGWPVPKTVPLWAGILILVLLFQMVTAPLQALRYALHYGFQAPQRPPQDAISGLVSLFVAAFGFWLLYQYVPEVREFVHALPSIGRDVWESLSQGR